MIHSLLHGKSHITEPLCPTVKQYNKIIFTIKITESTLPQETQRRDVSTIKKET